MSVIAAEPADPFGKEAGMSVTEHNGTKIELPRSGPDVFWGRVAEHYAGQSPYRWKLLVMLALRENGGWPLQWIGSAFGHSKGHVTRCIQKAKADMARLFTPPPAVVAPEPDELDEIEPGPEASCVDD